MRKVRSFIPLLACLPLAAGAQGVAWEFDAGAGMSAGDWTYAIGRDFTQNGETGRLHFPISELEWPVNGITLHAGARVLAGPLTLHGRLAVNLDGADAEMEDSDWEDLDNPRARTTFSESDVDAFGWEGDLGALMRVLGGDRWSLQLGAGYLAQAWEWEAADAVQFSVLPEDTGAIPGKVIEYEGDLSVPYLQAGMVWTRDPVSLRGRVGYSAWAEAEDRDDHLLRGILAEADTEGDAWLAELELRIELSRSIYGFINGRLLAFQTDGRSRNRVYDAALADSPLGETWEIDEEIESAQGSYTVGIGVRL